LILAARYQHFAQELRHAADIARVVELAGLLAGELDEVGHGLRRKLVGHEHRIERPAGEGYGREVLHEVGVRVARHLVQDVAHGGDQQRVAVGSRLRDKIGRDVACGAGAIVDDDALAQRAHHVLGELAGDDVVGRAGTERNDDGDRLVREILRSHRSRHRPGCKARQRGCDGRTPGPFRRLHGCPHFLSLICRGD